MIYNVAERLKSRIFWNFVKVNNATPNYSVQVPHWKRTLDIFVVLMSLPLVIPLALVIAVLIRSVSAGPVLFRQERVGYLGRRFMCFKFRTMFVGVDETTHQGHLCNLMTSNTPMTKMDSKGDPRIIPFGLLLRSSGLDELPQLINVLWGDMSMVGPRPCLPYEYEKYLPWQKERFATLPGLTGLWQVSGKNRTTFVEMIELDIKYGRNKNLWLDLKIILQTIPALIIQMLETRRTKRSSHGPARTEIAFVERAVKTFLCRRAILAEAIRAGQKTFE